MVGQPVDTTEDSMSFSSRRRKRRRDKRARAEGYVVLEGAWTGDLWESYYPIWVPIEMDVRTFLAQEPVPPVCPGNDGFIEYYGTDDKMRYAWVMVLLHHPDLDVVMQTLRSPFITNSMGHAVAVADVLIANGAPRDAVDAVWRMSDDAVRVVMTVVLDRGITGSPHSSTQSEHALRVLRSTCPPGRRAMLEEIVAG